MRRCLLGCPNIRLEPWELCAGEKRCGECGARHIPQTWDDVQERAEFKKRVPPEEGDLIREEWR
jgi:hypothetical protein